MAVEVVSFPAEDAAFCACASGLAAALSIREVDRIVETLQAALRTRYPDASVTPQDPLGRLDGTPIRIYAYRDGDLVTTLPGRPRGGIGRRRFLVRMIESRP